MFRLRKELNDRKAAVAEVQILKSSLSLVIFLQNHERDRNVSAGGPSTCCQKRFLPFLHIRGFSLFLNWLREDSDHKNREHVSLCGGK